MKRRERGEYDLYNIHSIDSFQAEWQ
jgi:hypothetical protein